MAVSRAAGGRQRPAAELAAGEEGEEAWGGESRRMPHQGGPAGDLGGRAAVAVAVVALDGELGDLRGAVEQEETKDMTGSWAGSASGRGEGQQRRISISLWVRAGSAETDEPRGSRGGMRRAPPWGATGVLRRAVHAALRRSPPPSSWSPLPGPSL